MAVNLQFAPSPTQAGNVNCPCADPLEVQVRDMLQHVEGLTNQLLQKRGVPGATKSAPGVTKSAPDPTKAVVSVTEYDRNHESLVQYGQGAGTPGRVDGVNIVPPLFPPVIQGPQYPPGMYPPGQYPGTAVVGPPGQYPGTAVVGPEYPPGMYPPGQYPGTAVVGPEYPPGMYPPGQYPGTAVVGEPMYPGGEVITVKTYEGREGYDSKRTLNAAPHHTKQQPQQTMQKPHPTMQQPQQTMQQPHPTMQQPQQTMQQPHPTMQQPQQTMQLMPPQQTMQLPGWTSQKAPGQTKSAADCPCTDPLEEEIRQKILHLEQLTKQLQAKKGF